MAPAVQSSVLHPSSLAANPKALVFKTHLIDSVFKTHLVLGSVCVCIPCAVLYFVVKLHNNISSIGIFC